MLHSKKAVFGLALITALIGELEAIRVCFDFGDKTPSFLLNSDPATGAAGIEQHCSCDTAKACSEEDQAVYDQYVKEIERPTDTVTCCYGEAPKSMSRAESKSEEEQMKILNESCAVEKIGSATKKKFYTIDAETKWRHICHCSQGSTDTVCARLPGTEDKPCFLGCLSRMAKIRRDRANSCCLAPLPPPSASGRKHKSG